MTASEQNNQRTMPLASVCANAEESEEAAASHTPAPESETYGASNPRNHTANLKDTLPRIETLLTEEGVTEETQQARLRAQLHQAKTAEETERIEAEARKKEAAIRADAELKAAKYQAKNKNAAARMKHRENSINAVGKVLTNKYVILFIAASLTAIAAACAIPYVLNGINTTKAAIDPEPTFDVRTSIVSALPTEKLNVLDFEYEGIAEYTGDGHEDKPLHVHYSASMYAHLVPSDTQVEVDDERKAVILTLPEIKKDPPVLSGSPDFLEGNETNVDLSAARMACEEDAWREVEESSEMGDIAISNAKSGIEVMLKGILEYAGYKIEWSDEIESSEDGSEEKHAE